MLHRLYEMNSLPLVQIRNHSDNGYNPCSLATRNRDTARLPSRHVRESYRNLHLVTAEVVEAADEGEGNPNLNYPVYGPPLSKKIYIFLH